jgi:hypothetical protein
MSKLILNEWEICEITLNKQAKKQAEILGGLGIPFVLGRDGRLRVLRQDASAPPDARYGRVRARREAEPNLEGLGRK